MKKFLLSLGVACMTLSTFASTRILYQQNFETAVDAESSGWSYGGTSLSIASDSFGKFLELNQGSANGRSGKVAWGQEIFMDGEKSLLGEDGLYTLKFDFCIAAPSDNQYNSSFTIFTNHAGVDNQPYRNPWSPAGYWQNYLFDMSQVANEGLQFAINGGTTETTAEDGTVSYAIDYSDPSTIGQGEWYTVTLDVNTIERTVDYSVMSLAGDELKSGTLEVPAANYNGEEISMFAEGLFIMVARRNAIYDIDNIVVSVETEYDFANDPTIAMTRLGKTADEEENPAIRAYTISFLDGETLHVLGTDGKETVVEYYDTDEGNYVYETTTSGKLQAWTTVGDAKSNVIETEVDCTPIALPAVTATISSVSEGYGKTYTLSVDNSNVELRPNIFISYTVYDENGDPLESKEDQASGAVVTLKGKGSIKLTSAAYGYQSTTVTVENDIEFATKKVYDFARMTKEEIVATGVPSEFTVLNTATTSGFSNWTGRKRLYYELAGSEHPASEEDQTPVLDKVYPFGFVAEDNTTNVIEYSVKDNASITDSDVDGTGYFEGLSIFPKTGKGNKNFGFMYRIGIFNDQTNDNYNNIIVHDLDQSDFVVFNYINNYGGNSNHPVCSNDEEYFKQLKGEDAVYSVAATGEINEETGKYSVTYPLYRVDTACTMITIYKQTGNSVEGIEATEVAGDNYYYTIDGIRVAEPTNPGLYIHNGKKIIVK